MVRRLKQKIKHNTKNKKKFGEQLTKKRIFKKYIQLALRFIFYQSFYLIMKCRNS